MTWLSLTILLFVLGSGALYLLRVLKGKAINPAITDKTEKGEKAKTGQVRESNLYCQSATSDTCNVCLKCSSDWHHSRYQQPITIQ